jgi:hypothetical protein
MTGHTTKRTMTLHRATLLGRCPISITAAYSELRAADRKQLNDCVRYGWATHDREAFRITPKGAKLVKPLLAESRRQIVELARKGTFKNLGPVRGAQECMLHVYWSGLGDAGDDGRGHIVQRGRVTADLGYDGVPDPPFTDEEMQDIMRAAKMEAGRCLARRKR